MIKVEELSEIKVGHTVLVRYEEKKKAYEKEKEDGKKESMLI